jgi:hypothetical protein
MLAQFVPQSTETPGNCAGLCCQLYNTFTTLLFSQGVPQEPVLSHQAIIPPAVSLSVGLHVLSTGCTWGRQGTGKQAPQQQIK